MSDWGGFSEAELSRLRSGGDVKPKQPTAPSGKKGLGGAVRKTTKKKKPEKVPTEAMLPTTTTANNTPKETPKVEDPPAEPAKELVSQLPWLRPIF